MPSRGRLRSPGRVSAFGIKPGEGELFGLENLKFKLFRPLHVEISRSCITLYLHSSCVPPPQARGRRGHWSGRKGWARA